MQAKGAHPRAGDGDTSEDDPAKRLDPHNTVGFGSGQPLIPRTMPRELEFMIELSGNPVEVPLWECEAWHAGGLGDILAIPGDRWAMGHWDHKTRRYAVHPAAAGFRLKEISRGDVIALCNRLDRIYPPQILREMGAALSKPAADQLVEVHDALNAIFHQDRHPWNDDRENEEERASLFMRLADALRPFRTPGAPSERHPRELERRINAVSEALDKIVSRWGWTWLYEPKPARQAFLEQRREQTQGDLSQPQFGQCYPRMNQHEYDSMSQAFNELSHLLPRVEQPDRQPEVASQPPSPRKVEKPVSASASGTVAPRRTSTRMSYKEPSARAISAYRAVKMMGQKQEDVAPQFGVSQGTVSRWVKQVSEWIATGNILPDLDVPRRKAVTMDPRKLEQGPRRPRAHK
jgi:transposase